jgi:hypothetical protein
MRHHEGAREELRALLSDICRERAFTTEELATLVGRAPATILGHLCALQGTVLVRDETDHWSLAVGDG